MASIVYRIAETEGDLQGYYAVRQAIFAGEQALFEGSDRDEHDDVAVHIVAVDRDTDEVVGAVRCYDAGDGTWYGGRLAVLKEYRRVSGLTGCHLVKMAEDVVRQRGCRRFLAHVQLQNVRFFQHMGWRSQGDPEIHYGQPHQVMEANLSPSTTPMRSLVHA
jgi:putative N-acetyltransferase (TIGR04045 family)